MQKCEYSWTRGGGGGGGMVYLYLTLVKNISYSKSSLKNYLSKQICAIVPAIVPSRGGTIGGTIGKKVERYVERYSLDRHGPCNWPMCCSMPILRRLLAFFLKAI